MASKRDPRSMNLLERLHRHHLEMADGGDRACDGYHAEMASSIALEMRRQGIH